MSQSYFWLAVALLFATIAGWYEVRSMALAFEEQERWLIYAEGWRVLFQTWPSIVLGLITGAGIVGFKLYDTIENHLKTKYKAIEDDFRENLNLSISNERKSLESRLNEIEQREAATKLLQKKANEYAQQAHTKLNCSQIELDQQKQDNQLLQKQLQNALGMSNRLKKKIQRLETKHEPIPD